MTSEEKKIYRMLDANYNRAKEALRVAEDTVRFSDAGPAAVQSWKKARHHLSTVVLRFPKSYKAIVACRDVPGDSGKKLQIQDREGRVRLVDLFAANVQRAQEAVRVLEECSKAVFPSAAPQFQKLRFELYHLEKRDLEKL